MSRNTLRKWLTLIFGNVIVVLLLQLVTPLSLRIFLYAILFVSDVLAALKLIGYRLRR